MEKLKIETNKPVIISLAYTRGREVESTQGYDPQMLYTLTGGLKWYAPLSVAEKIDALQLGKGEPVQVLKREVWNDEGKKRTVYEVTRPETALVVQPQQYPGQPAAPTQPPAPRVVETRESETASQDAATTTTGNQQAQGSTREYTRPAKLYMACFRDAFDIAHEVEAYSARRSMKVQFLTEDLRAIAASLFIEANKAGRN